MFVDNLSIDDLADAALPYYSSGSGKSVKRMIKPLDLKAHAERKEEEKDQNGDKL